MDKAVSLVSATLNTEFSKVLQLLPNRRSLLLVSGCGWNKELIGKAMVGTGVNSQAGYALRADKLVIVEDLRSEPRFQGTPMLSDHGIISGMASPLRGEVGTWGVLATHSRRKKKFTPGEQEFFQCMSNMLSAAIQRSSQHATCAEMNENLQLALKIADVGTWRLDPDTMLTTRDANLNRIWGLEPVDSTQPFEEFLATIHSEDRARIFKHFHHALDNRQSTEIDFRIVRHDGAIRWLHSRGRMLRAGYMTGAAMDITESKQAEEVRAQLAAIVESSEDAIVSGTLEGVVTSWNPGAEKLFQYSASEIIGQTGSRFIPQDRQHEYQAVLSQLRAGETPHTFETVRLRKDGTPVDVSVAVSLLRGDKREPIGASAIIRNVSRRKKIERALQQNEARLRVALEAGQMGSWEWEFSTDEMVWSPTMEKIHGKLQGSFEGTFKAFARDICPEHQETVLRQVSEALENKSNLQIEYCLNSGTWVEGRGAVLVDESGAPVRMVGVCSDISQRKLSEQYLRESEERFRNVADAAPVMIWMSGIDQLVTYFNKGWLSFRGRSEQEEFGFGWAEGIHRDDYETCLKTYQEAFDRREPFQTTYRLRRHDGEFRFVFDSGVPRFDSEGRFLGYVGSVVDITEVKQAEQALSEEATLRASELRFKEIADAMPHMVWEVALDGSFDYFNQRWHDYTGIQDEKGTAETWESVAHPQDWPLCRERWGAAFASNVPCETECRLRNAAGEFRWHLCRTVPIRDKDSNVQRWIGTATDIEDQKKFQAELAYAKEELRKRAVTLETAVNARTKELEDSLKTTETLIYTIAHDLRAPLRAMQGLSLAVVEDYAFRLDDDGRELLGRINTSAVRMDRLISDLLAYGRLGYMELSLQNLDLNHQVDLVLAEFAEEIHQKKAEIIRADLPSVYANATVLRQILANLIANALKFVAPKSNPKIEVLAETKTDQVRITVRDNGIGIDPHHCRRIFEVFQRLHTQEDYPGTGIGLAMVAKAAQRLGGFAGVVSEPGKGSSFWVDLPRAAGP